MYQDVYDSVCVQEMSMPSLANLIDCYTFLYGAQTIVAKQWFLQKVLGWTTKILDPSIKFSNLETVNFFIVQGCTNWHNWGANMTQLRT